MTSSDLLDYTHRYREVRGWSARRVYITLRDLLSLRCTLDAHFGGDGCQYLFDGAAIRKVRSTDVADRIREWDLAP